jgi:hypothetical protein
VRGQPLGGLERLVQLAFAKAARLALAVFVMVRALQQHMQTARTA